MTYHQSSDDFENDYLQDMEETWLKSIPRFTDTALLEMFGDALDTMDDKISELKRNRKEYIRKIYEMGKKYVHGDDIDSYFALQCIEHSLIKELQKVEMSLYSIQRLKGLKNQPKRKRKGGITDEDIEKARDIPLVNLAEQYIGQFRKSGANYVAKCPFHDDGTPSFYIYSESNRFHCFGCGVNGDVIAFIQKVAGLDFKEAIYFLIQK
jgi:DNA primase